MDRKSLADQYKSQYQSTNIAWKAEEQAHNATLANLNGIQRSLSHSENMLELQRKENDELRQANDKLNEQLIEVNINHQMELEQAQTNLEDAQDKLRESERMSKIEAQKYIKENANSTASTKSCDEKEVESIKLELEQVKIELNDQSVRHQELQNQAKIDHNALKEKYAQLLTETEKDKNLKVADTDSNTQLLEKHITELQAQLLKEQAYKATQSAVSGSQNVKYTALKADYELAIREIKNLKRAKVT